MNKDLSLPLLIIGYKRLGGIREIVESALQAGVDSIFISVDGVREGDSSGAVIHQQILELINGYSERFPGKFFALSRQGNRGCSAAVLSSIDWFFSQVDKGLILEDDCLPTEGFFKFSEYSIDVLESEKEVWLSCGSQFAPYSVTQNVPAFSGYPLIWGWATTKNKWSEIRLGLIEDMRADNRINFKMGAVQFYWYSGSRRARKGYVDAWDTPLVWTMQQRKKFALLPGSNLVSNRGIDEHAIHTINQNPWINFPTAGFNVPNRKPVVSKELDEWLSKNFYRISVLHPLRNLARYLLDKLRQPVQLPLLARWDAANKDWATE